MFLKLLPVLDKFSDIHSSLELRVGWTGAYSLTSRVGHGLGAVSLQWLFMTEASEIYLFFLQQP